LPICVITKNLNGGAPVSRLPTWRCSNLGKKLEAHFAALTKFKVKI